MEAKRQLDSLNKKVEALTMRPSNNPVNLVQSEVCSNFINPMHVTPSYPSMLGYTVDNSEQVNAMNEYGRIHNPFSNTYNPGWRNHPNFSWSQNQSNNNIGNQNNMAHQTPLV